MRDRWIDGAVDNACTVGTTVNKGRIRIVTSIYHTSVSFHDVLYGYTNCAASDEVIWHASVL